MLIKGYDLLRLKYLRRVFIQWM